MNRFLSICAFSVALVIAGCGDSPSDDATLAESTDTTTVHRDHSPSAQDEPATATMRDGVQEVRVTVRNDGYDPSRIELQEGVPTRLIFVQEATSPCASEVQVPDMNVEKTTLPQGEETAVEFTPDETGEFAFVCGMEMVSGTLIVRS